MEVFEGLGAALTAAQIIQKIAIPISKNVAERLSPDARHRFMVAVEKFQSDTQEILSSLASMQESRMKTACLHIKLAMTELHMCCKQWNSGHEPSVITASSSPWGILTKSEDYNNAIRRFKRAEAEAMAVLHDDKNVRSHIRVEAMRLILFCQIVLHWKKPEEWFHLWMTVFENSFFNDRDLVKITLLKPNRLKDAVSPEDKVARVRMEQLINEMAEAIVRIVAKDGSNAGLHMAVKAQQFVKAFNHYATQSPDLRRTDDWMLLGPAEASFSGVLWFACAWGKVGLLPCGDQFIAFSDCKDPTYVAPGVVYAVGSAGQLLKIDSRPPMRRSVVATGNWTILGCAGDRGSLYAINDNALKRVCVSVKPGCANGIPAPPESDLADYVFLVATNGSVLAYNRGSRKRFVRFASSRHSWMEIDDTDRSELQTTVTRENQLLADCSDDSNRLVRLSLTYAGGGVQIQAEKIRLLVPGNKVVSKFDVFDIDVSPYGAALATNFSRLPVSGAKEGRVYVVGYVDSSAVCLAKLRLFADRGRITKKAKFEVESKYQAELYPRMQRNKISFGNGIIFM